MRHVVILFILALFACQSEAPRINRADQAITGDPVGLSLNFINGVMAPIALVGDAPRYLQEIDVRASVTTSEDLGLAPLILSGEMADLDWTGVVAVETDWRFNFFGQIVRTTYYRGAHWMDHQSSVQVFPGDAAGNEIGPPIHASFGEDDVVKSSDDGFVRRFVARQEAIGCPSGPPIGGPEDCTGATFVAEGLVQWRYSLNPSEARTITPAAETLVVEWSAEDLQKRVVPITHVTEAASPWTYGLNLAIEAINVPPAGYYMPGDAVQLKVHLTDNDGVPLNTPGSLPTYGDFLFGIEQSGLRYLNDFGLDSRLYWAQKNREGSMEVALSGPLDALKISQSVIGPDQLFNPQQVQATVATDGYTTLVTEAPGTALIFLCLIFGQCQIPPSDVFTFTLPADALPGTYIALFKARREFGGESQAKEAEVLVQVGTLTPSVFTPRTANCETCHSGQASLGVIHHGVADPQRKACFVCHGPVFFEPDASVDQRVHKVHDESNRFASVADIHDCTLCHSTTPTEPGREIRP